MSIADPYASPNANLNRGEEEVAGPVPVWSFTGRVGRLRYLAYTTAATLIFYAVIIFIGACTAALKLSPILIMAVGAVGYLLFMVFGVSLAIRRAHDFNVSGWWIGLMFLVQVVGGAAFGFLGGGLGTGHFGIMQIIVGIAAFIAWIFAIVFALMLLFRAGTRGSNHFGLAPPPNSTGVKVLAFGFPVMIMLVGILAAIALPAYQQYVKRAHAAEATMQRQQ